MNQDQAGSDVTATARGLIRPIAQRLWDELDGDLSEEDESRIGWALVDALKAGMRLGMAELAASVMEDARKQGVNLDLHVYLHDRGDDGGDD